MDTISLNKQHALPPVVLTAAEHARLSAVASAQRKTSVDLLERELERAIIVPGETLAADVVTMGSTVEYVDTVTGDARTVTLVYPWRADIAKGLISITAPVGAALIGLKVGDVMMLTTPAGTLRRLRILRLISRPRA